jgi:uncharacterized Zn ribbon protein
MSEDFNDTTDCPNCRNENAYFNGFNYECPDCGYEWDDNDNAEDGDLYFDEQDKKEKEFRR